MLKAKVFRFGLTALMAFGAEAGNRFSRTQWPIKIIVSNHSVLWFVNLVFHIREHRFLIELLIHTALSYDSIQMRNCSTENNISFRYFLVLEMIKILSQNLSNLISFIIIWIYLEALANCLLIINSNQLNKNYSQDSQASIFIDLVWINN